MFNLFFLYLVDLNIVQKSCYMKRLLFLGIILISFAAKGQYNFHLSNIYFEGQKITKISKGGSGHLWCIAGENNSNIYSLDQNGDVSDLSSLFLEATSSSFTGIHDIDPNNILVSTLDDYIYNYNNGIITHLNENNGFEAGDSFITSIVGNNYSIKVGSSTHRYQSSDGINYSIIWESDTSTYFFTDCYMLKNALNFSIIFNSYSGVNEFNGSSLPDYLGNVNVATLNPPSWNYKWFVGTENGLYMLDFPQGDVFLPNQEVFQFMKYTSNNLIVAADSGLYSVNNYAPPVPIQISGLETMFTAYDIYEDESGIIYVATDIGLLELVNDNCFEFNINLTTNRTQVNLNNSEDVIFNLSGVGGALSHIWDFGDGTSSIEQNPTHTFNEVGNYIVSVIATNDICSDTAYKNIVVFNHPNPYPGLFSENENIFNFSTNNENRSNVHIIKDENDSLSDIFVSNREITNGTVFENSGDHAYAEIALNDFPYIEHSAWADYNNDGFIDMISCGNYNSASIVKLHRNLGNNLFEISTIFENVGPISSLQWVDYDNDGLLDIFIGSRLSDSYLLHNDNNNTFNLSDEVVFENDVYLNMGSWADFDNDNDMDLFMLKTSGNSLYVNNGDGSFTEQQYFSNQIAGTTCSWADYDNDGYLELYITGFGNYVIENNQTDGLHLVNHGILSNDTYSSAYSSSNDINGTSTDWNDFDNNGHIDLIKYNGSIQGKVYMNLGDNIFYNDTSNVLNAENHYRGYRAVSNDMNNDGFVDIITIAGDDTDGGENHYFSNNGNSNNFVNIFCVGTVSNRSAIGAKVFVSAQINGETVNQLREIHCMTGRRAQKGFNTHFGLGDASVIDSLRIEWPSGIVTERTNLSLNEIYTIIEPGLRIPQEPYCDNSGVILEVPNITGVTYQWLLNNNSIQDATEAMFITIISGDYSVIINQAIGQDTTNSATINILPSPEILTNYSGDSTICNYDSLTVIASGGIDYFWLNNDSIFYNNPDSIYTVFNSGSYYAIGYNEHGCRDTSNQIIISIAPDSVYFLGNDTVICEGNTIVFGNELEGISYVWQNGLSDPYVIADTTGTYIRTVLDEHACQYTDSVHLIVNVDPVVELGNDTIICASSSFFIELNIDNANYDWSNGTSSNFIYINHENTYSVTVTDPNGCLAIDSIEVYQYPSIFVDLGNDTSITTGQTLEIHPDVNGNVDFLWSNGSTEDHIIINGAEFGDGEYHIELQITDSLGCFSGDYILITVNSLINISEVSRSELILYPNPTSSTINIDLKQTSSAPKSMKLINALGQTVEEKAIANVEVLFDFRTLDGGVYTMIIYFDQKFKVFKIIYAPEK